MLMHVHETWKGQFARARARTAVAWFETKFRIKFRIIFQNICITFPLCSREHASSILESIAASALVAGRTFSLREGIRVHKVARSPTSVCVRCCDYPAGIRVSKGNSSKRLCSFQISTTIVDSIGTEQNFPPFMIFLSIFTFCIKNHMCERRMPRRVQKHPHDCMGVNT